MSPSESQAILVRPAAANDMSAVVAIDHSFSTDYVWQMDLRVEERQTQVTFREVRLPRSMRVAASRSVERLAAEWSSQPLFIVAETGGQVRGYLAIVHGTLPSVAFVADCAVDRRSRRGGIGTALVSSAVDWAVSAGMQRLIIETQSKNYPAICFCRKHGFVYCGYNDRYYPNQDIAIFFGLTLK